VICASRAPDATFNFTGAAKALPSLLFGTLMLPLTIGMKHAKAIYLRGGKVTANRRLITVSAMRPCRKVSGTRQFRTSSRNSPSVVR